MASVKQSRARTDLDYALGEKRINIGELTPKEFDSFLERTLYGVNLRKLHGFKPLEEVICASGLRNTHVNDYATFNEVNPQSSMPIHFKIHAASLSGHHFLENHLVFRQHETGKETFDIHEGASWGKTAFIDRGARKILTLVRPSGHKPASQHLVTVEFWYKKAELKNWYEILGVETERVSIENFREHFQGKYPEVAFHIISEIGNLHGYTVSNLEGNLGFMRKEKEKFERIFSAVSC